MTDQICHDSTRFLALSVHHSDYDFMLFDRGSHTRKKSCKKSNFNLKILTYVESGKESCEELETS